MSYWTLNVRLIDSKQLETMLRLIIGEITAADYGAEATIAWARANQLMTDLKAITDANVKVAYLNGIDTAWDDAGLPADADVSDELVIVAHTNDSDKPTEVDRLRIPAPSSGVWVNSDPASGLDVSNAGVQAYVANFDIEFEFSDGEHVNLSEGTGGIAEGYWRSKKATIR